MQTLQSTARRSLPLLALGVAVLACEGQSCEPEPEPEQVCGDGRVQGSEECDEGSDNSDLRPNACRTDCTLPTCGDDVIDDDFGETCDPCIDCEIGDDRWHIIGEWCIVYTTKRISGSIDTCDQVCDEWFVIDRFPCPGGACDCP